MKYRLLSATALVAMLSMGATTGAYAADPKIWVSDSSGHIGLVDVVTGGVTLFNATTGNTPLTDIGFIGTQMYGTDFSNLYAVSTATGALTGKVALTGGGGGMNALLGSGGVLLGASNADNNLFSIGPTTGVATVTGVHQPGASAGDLTFFGSTLYASEIDPATGNDMLVNASTGTKIADFAVGAAGPGLNNLFGLATTAGTVYAVAGQDIYTLNLANGVLTNPVSWAFNNTLGQAFGAAVLNESPAPNLGEGVLGFAAMTALLIGVRYRGLFV